MALYRKYRPLDFAEVVGQKVAVHSLQNALKTGQWSHAYLFAGPRGTGKTTVARILAKAFNCLSFNAPAPFPCKSCNSCLSIRDGTSYDVREMDAASHRGIDEIRNIRDAVMFPPLHARFKIYILDEAHMLTREAFNALLKTLEEPPSYIVFILCTTEPNKIPLTILSRCQKMDFGRITLEEFSSWIQEISRKEQIRLKDTRSLQLLYDFSEGIPRDALSLLEQLSIYSGSEIDEQTMREFLGIPAKSFSLDVLQSILKQKEDDLLQLAKKGFEQGWSFWTFLNQFQAVARDVLAVQMRLAPSQLYSEMERAQLQSLAKTARANMLHCLFDTIGNIRFLYKWEADGRLLWDIALLTLLSALAERFPEARSLTPKAQLQASEEIPAFLPAEKERKIQIEGKEEQSPVIRGETEGRFAEFQEFVMSRSPTLAAFLFGAEAVWDDALHKLILQYSTVHPLISVWQARTRIPRELERLLTEFIGNESKIEWKSRDITREAEEKLQKAIEEVMRLFPGSQVSDK